MNSSDRARHALLSLEMACYHAAHDYPGGVEALAALMGCNAQVLRNKLNPNCTTHSPNSRDIRLIAELTQDLRILQSFCSIFGAAYFLLPQCDGDDGSLFERSADVMREVGEMMGSVRESLADGKVDADEVKRLDKSLLELMAVSKVLVETAKHIGGVVSEQAGRRRRYGKN